MVAAADAFLVLNPTDLHLAEEVTVRVDHPLALCSIMAEEDVVVQREVEVHLSVGVSSFLANLGRYRHPMLLNRGYVRLRAHHRYRLRVPVDMVAVQVGEAGTTMGRPCYCAYEREYPCGCGF